MRHYVKNKKNIINDIVQHCEWKGGLEPECRPFACERKGAQE